MSFHDEPMVVENGPLGLDLGERHGTDAALFEEDAATASWIRKNSALRMLTVIRKRSAAGQTDDFVSFHLDTAQPVEINLADPPGTSQGALTLTFSGAGNDAQVRIQPKMFTLMRMGRRMSHSGDLRIMNIKFVARELDAGGQPTSVQKELVMRPGAASPIEFGTVIAMLHS